MTAPAINLGTLRNGITEQTFLSRFPRRYQVSALTPWEAGRAHLSPDRTWWRFDADFLYHSDRYGPITVPAGMVTDFASVPLSLRSIFDDDSPIMLYPSAPHDFLFRQRADGSRGWLSSGRQLSLSQVNNVLTEAMWYCGASAFDRERVFMALQIANHGIRHLFGQEVAP